MLVDTYGEIKYRQNLITQLMVDSSGTLNSYDHPAKALSPLFIAPLAVFTVLTTFSTKCY